MRGVCISPIRVYGTGVVCPLLRVARRVDEVSERVLGILSVIRTEFHEQKGGEREGGRWWRQVVIS